MTMETQRVDLKQATTNPSKVFGDPSQVLTHPGLSREAKLEILRQWETDARLLQTAESNDRSFAT